MKLSYHLSAELKADPAEIIYAGWQHLFACLQTELHDYVH
jgi:hypothetical protein